MVLLAAVVFGHSQKLKRNAAKVDANSLVVKFMVVKKMRSSR